MARFTISSRLTAFPADLDAGSDTSKNILKLSSVRHGEPIPEQLNCRCGDYQHEADQGRYKEITHRRLHAKYKGAWESLFGG